MHRTSDPAKDSPQTPPTGSPLSVLPVDQLPIYLVGNAVDRDALYEQLFAHCRRITLRYEDARGDPEFVELPLSGLRQIGFEENDDLFPNDERSFRGFDMLRDFFVFPNKYAGFRLHGLRGLLARMSSHSVDILFEFDTTIPRLASVVTRSQFALFAVPAVNLFEMQCSRIPIRRNESEHQIVPDRSRWLDFEVHRIVDVFAHYPGLREKEPVFPLYNLPATTRHADELLFYTARRLPRQRTEHERRFGTQTRYAGSETFLSLFEPRGLDDEVRVKELSVRALVSNRHLPEQLPVGDTGADFRLADDMSVGFRCIFGPTAPRESLINLERTQRESTRPGPMLWRLINFLSLSHLGLMDPGEKGRPTALRELLAMFADLSDNFSERQLNGIVGVASRPIVRRLRQETGFNAARGIEVSITFDENAFEETGIMVLGAALERFLAEYTAINSFTETVIVSVQRGVVMRWPPRSGLGNTL
jgi:type VI secretion system protein ImpG